MAVAAILPTDVTAFAPELSVLKDAAWVDILAYVNELTITTTDCGSSVKPTDVVVRMARIYLAAHIGSMHRQGNAGVAGPVQSESVGGIRRSYMVGLLRSSNSFLNTTPYGQMYLDVLGMSAAARGPILL